MTKSLLLLVCFVARGLPAAILFIPCTLITGDIMPLYRASMWILRAGYRVAGIRVQVDGLEHVPRGVACIFMSNHVSNLDPPTLFPLIPGRTSIYLKRSLMNIPILGYAMRLARFIPVTRDVSVASAQESVRRAAEVLADGIHITTFVEGTRSSDGRLLPFKKGPFFLAVESGAPCIPITICGTGAMMRKGSLRIAPGTARVVFHAPIDPRTRNDRAALMEAVRESIASALPEDLRTAP